MEGQGKNNAATKRGKSWTMEPDCLDSNFEINGFW